MTFLRYDPSVEVVTDDEEETFQKIADTFAEMGRKVQSQIGRAVRVSHAKATGLLAGELTFNADLALELAQGLAATPARYETLIRFAQGPGELLHDKISTHRGMAVKVLGVPGASISEGDEETQDFVLEGTSQAFINANATTFLTNLRSGVSNAPSLPEGFKSAVSTIARTAEAGLEAVGLHTKTLGFFGHPLTHPLAEAYFSQVPMRWGGYIAKLGFFPTQATVDGIAHRAIDTSKDHEAFRNAMIAHFTEAGAEFELRVQLATDLEITPVEDASTEWPEEKAPYRPVGRLVIRPQSAWSSERDEFFARLSFRPGNSLDTHRPLGQVMRARLFVYSKLSDLRRQQNADAPLWPKTSALPD